MNMVSPTHKQIPTTTTYWPRDSISWPIDGFDDMRWRRLEPYDKTERLTSRQIRSTLWSDRRLLYKPNTFLSCHQKKKAHTNILCYRHSVSCVGSKTIDQYVLDIVLTFSVLKFWVMFSCFSYFFPISHTFMSLS